jgi:AcrR family transcriptional regulator
MKAKPKKLPARRQPKQQRARQTVDAVLDAVVRILKREGLEAVTTNRVAEVAGVSVGSVYQYFSDKRAIFTALHARHVEEMGRLIERTLISHASSSLEDLVRALVEAMIAAHSADPELHELLSTTVPHGGNGEQAFEDLLRGTLRLAISARAPHPYSPQDLERVLFVLTHMVEALSHGASVRRPAKLSLNAAKEESVRAILAYLRASFVWARSGCGPWSRKTLVPKKNTS